MGDPSTLNTEFRIGHPVGTGVNFSGMTMREVVQEAAARGLQLEMVGRGIARAQLPQAGSMLPRGEKVRVAFGR